MSELEQIIDRKLAEARNSSTTESTTTNESKKDKKQESEENEAKQVKSVAGNKDSTQANNSNSKKADSKSVKNISEQNKSRCSGTKSDGLAIVGNKNSKNMNDKKPGATDTESKSLVSGKNNEKKEQVKSSESKTKNVSKPGGDKKTGDKPDAKTSAAKSKADNEKNANKNSTKSQSNQKKSENTNKKPTDPSFSKTNGKNSSAQNEKNKPENASISKKDENISNNAAGGKTTIDKDRNSKSDSKGSKSINERDTKKDSSKSDKEHNNRNTNKSQNSSDKESKKDTNKTEKNRETTDYARNSRESNLERGRSNGSIRERSRSRTYRERSRSPRNRSSRALYAPRRYSPLYTGRRYSPDRSPPRRSRTPIRGSYRDALRLLSPSRPRYDRSRSPINSKALIAKKSFLDDLAVKFAQQGKEFPELEQFRCKINSQFVSYPQRYSAERNPQHTYSAGFDGPRFPMMDDGPPMDNRPMMFSNQFDPPRYQFPPVMQPEPVIDVPPLISYPIPGMQQMMEPNNFINEDSQDMVLTQINTSSKNKVVADFPSIEKAAVLGPQQMKKCTKGEVKNHVIQALDLLDELGLTVSRTSKFMYRAPTFYKNDVHHNRSKVVQSPTNPLFTFSSRCGESSDPFGNIPRKLKPIINLLSLDEGAISRKIFLRAQTNAKNALLYRERLELEERQKRLQPKLTLQKNTQTDPTVCKECLMRMIKVKVNCETQTISPPSVESMTQTNPMPVQTVSEFGSITELTPNQVRAVSELIKYIKLTVTSGTLTEMRNSMRDDQVYNLNSDLRTAFQYFDAMVERKNPADLAPRVPQDPPTMLSHCNDFDEITDRNDDIVEPASIPIAGPMDEEDEYEQYHKAFCEGEPDTEVEDPQDNYNEGDYHDIQEGDAFGGFQHIPPASRPRTFGYNSNSRAANYGTGDSSYGSNDGYSGLPHQAELYQQYQGNSYGHEYNRRGHSSINRRN
ncbi:uncharacterized protein LOC129732861 [Wyeomyia smithii]|uniref:uncharacterized protein LOC129732861 n=1 Tax=Wyeomyia smithii TaxID=174621 RepID=UPI002467E664|nr:uncharacterized protein LOC129732861 [Wyeomyia smithii]